MADRKGRKTFIYSTQGSNFRKDAVYENPRYFEKLPPQGLKQYDEVIVIGNWPKVQAALDAAEIDWRPGDKGDDVGEGSNSTDNTGLVRGAPTGSSQGAIARQKEGTIPQTGGPVNEGEGDGSGASTSTTGDGEETVARETGSSTADLMDGSTQTTLAPADGAPTQEAIPDDWEDLAWPDLKALAGKFTNDPVTSKALANKAIKAELAKRG